MKKFTAWVILAALFGTLVFAMGRLLKSSEPNVILIVLDTLRADHLGTYGYARDTSPHLDQFAAENLQFNYAMTAAPWTPASLASMFSGVYPSRHGMMPPDGRGLAKQSSHRLESQVETLAEIFSAHGYLTAGITPNPWLKSEFGYNQGFDRYHYRDRDRAAEINGAAFKVISEITKQKKPFFLFLHYLDPHDPYDAPEPYGSMFKGKPPGLDYAPEMEQLINAYDGEIRYMDDRVGELFAFLKEQGLYDNSRIVILGDHGEQFKEHGNLTHGFMVHTEELHIPLLVKSGQPHRAPDFTVSSIDIFPTLLEMAGIPVPATAQGLSLLNDENFRAREGVLSEIKRKYNQKAFTNFEGRKLILEYPLESGLVQEDPAGGKVLGVFDRHSDYAELHPSLDPALIAPLKQELSKLYADTVKGRIESTEAPVSDKTLEQLKSLGYLH
ncbi:MAG: sulfatase [Oligoflexia bacterium]|nr:sulfatase [Oligoflexia bacterium]